MKFILGQKIGMTRVFDEEGRSFAVTMVKALPCKVSQIKTKEKDGYKAIQIEAYKAGEKEKSIRKNEFRIDNPGRYKVGQDINLKQFRKEELVSVEGISKGKGFAGTIKRHGFHRGPESHGSNNVREPGSIGGGYPQRVLLGRRMPGHLGTDTITIKNLKVIDIEKDIMLIAGAVPGPKKGIIKVYGSGEIAEEVVDTALIEEQLAMQKMLEDDKEKKEENEAPETAETVEVPKTPKEVK